MNNNFFYRGADGKNKLRMWVVAALIIFLVLGVVGGYSVYAASARQAQIDATPRPITGISTFTPTAVLPTAAPTSVGASTNRAADCPTDSADWNFVDVWENNNYKRIDPPCVYQGLNKPIAWLLAVQGAGYSNQDAINKLAFIEVPFDNARDVMDFLPAKQGDKPISTTVHWYPLHKDFQDWYVVNNSVVSDTFFVSGCYRTYDLVGSQKKYWSPQYAPSAYTAICEVTEDRPLGWDVSELNGNVFSVNITPGKRLFTYFAYDNRPRYQSWFYLGHSESFDLSVADVNETQAMAQQLLNSPVWDLAWLEKEYGFSPKPLPADWQKHTSKGDQDAILAILNK